MRISRFIKCLFGIVLGLLFIIGLGVVAQDCYCPCPNPEPQPTEYWDSFYGGMPLADETVTGKLQILDNIGFEIGYSNERKNPIWVCYRVFKTGSCQIRPRSSSWFKNDSRTATNVSTSFDHTTTHLDRGHLAPNSAIATCYGEGAQRQTFLMTNISPQHEDLNQGPWKRLEDEAKSLAVAHGEVWIMTGTIFDEVEELLPSSAVAEILKPEVPDAFYKIIVYEQQGSPVVRAYVMPEDAKQWADVRSTTVAEIEDKTGLDFLWMLEDSLEELIEGGKSPDGDHDFEAPCEACLQAFNRVTEAYLRNCPGIEELAKKIVDKRETLGTFTSLSQISTIPYIGPSRWNSLLDCLVECAGCGEPDR